MSTSSDMRDAGWELLRDLCGESVTLTPDGGTATSITVVWNGMGEEREEHSGAEVLVQHASVRANPDDVSSIDERAKFTRGGEANWAIADISHKGSFDLILLTRETRRLTGQRTGV